MLYPLSYGGSALTLSELTDRGRVVWSARADAVEVQFRSTWTDRNRTHITPTDKNTIEFVCIYCRATDDCYYIRPAEHGASTTLRVTPSGNGQQLGVLDAAAFRQLKPAVRR